MARRTARTTVALACALALSSSFALAAAAAPAARDAAAAHPSRALWTDMKGAPPEVSARGGRAALKLQRSRAALLDRASLGALAATAPAEGSDAARQSPLIISLPHPDGGFQRFSIVDAPVMEPGLAAKHPEIRSYAGRGVDDPAANLRMSITPLGVQASVRSPKGAWYIDPFYEKDDGVYVSYHRRDARRTAGALQEAPITEPMLSLARGVYHAGDKLDLRGAGFAAGALVAITVRGAGEMAPRQLVHATADADGAIAVTLKADPYRTLGAYSISASDGRNSSTTVYKVVADNEPTLTATGPTLRIYRLALLSDPGYATYHGAGNVTAAKAALITRVTQVYEMETAIRLTLIANNDALNLDTAAQFSGTNGPCGATACFPSASVSCSSATLTRNRQVVGLLVGASNFDIGHIGVGAGGGGIASLGVVGGNNKAQGCTGLPTPTGDLFAVDYVAHEMGHQFAGNHTFNGIAGSCSGGNRNASTSVEPGSGSSIMAYAGICSATDDLQPHSDPYWAQKSFDEITNYVSAAETSINEVQMAVMSGFTTNGQQFQLRYNGVDSIPIVRGTNFTTAAVGAAIQTLTGGTATVSALTDAGFTITFSGTLAGVNVDQLQLVNCTAPCTGYANEIAKGGLTTRGGSTIAATGNGAPVVTTPATFTIPLRTPFALTGSATDPDGDLLTYMWEQVDRGGSSGTSLTSNTKANGPLFRQFGTAAIVSSSGTLQYNSPGENSTTTNPTRVFPDLAQIIANNTNAETGNCPTVSGTPTAAQIDCYSEFLPNASYVGFTGVNNSPLSLNFRLTVRDGKGGVSSSATQLQLATGAGPFLVTAPNTAVTTDAGGSTTVTWSVANTNAAPVNTANVKISLSTDSGQTFPTVLAASTPNSGSAAVTLPLLTTTQARVKVEAVGNVFFDISNADFTIRQPGDLNVDGRVDCADLAIVRASLGKRTGDAGFDPRADVNNDGIVNLRDLSFVSQRVPTGTTCP